MLLGYPIGELAWLALLIVAAGVVTGIFSGLFGIGGGAVIVPVLYEVFRVLDVPEDMRMQLCIGTSLAIIVPTTFRSYIGHRKRGAVIPQVVRIWTLPAIAGVAIGSVTAALRAGYRVQDRIRDFRQLHLRAHVLPVATAGASATNCPAAGRRRFYGFRHGPVFIAGRCQRRRRVERGAHTLRADRCSARWRPRPVSACRSPLPAPSATCLAGWPHWRNCRRCRSDSFRCSASL